MSTSLGHFGNQAHESMNNVFQNVVNSVIRKQKHISKQIIMSLRRVKMYNTKPMHKYGVSPIHLENALALQAHLSKDQPQAPMLAHSRTL